jgi:cell wall-associated NlpC family hydrolase
MPFGICLSSCVPLLKSPEFWGELASELLFGERFEVLHSQGIFGKVRTAFDAYDGWIDLRQTTPIDPEEYGRCNESSSAVALDAITFVQMDDRGVMVLRGSSLPCYADGNFYVKGRKVAFGGNVGNPESRITREALKAFALSYIHTPYRWGGRTPFGIDCAAFVQIVYKTFGVCIPRETQGQKEQGSTIVSTTDAKVGDLAFFTSIAEGLPHVGLLFGDSVMHACGTVRIDAVDKTGIFDRRVEKYTYRLTEIRRVARVF